VKNFFQSIGEFLNKAEDYFDYRVRTGKYIGDIKVLVKEFRETSAKVIKSLITQGMHSKYYLDFTSWVYKYWVRLLNIPFFEYTVSMLISAVKIAVKYYAEIFIIFAVTFPSAMLLLNFFQSNVAIFFVTLLPILLANLYLVSALYLTFDQREKGIKSSLWSNLGNVWKKMPAVSAIFLFQVSLFVLVSVSFSILALFFRFFFDAIAVPWSGSFIYWFFVIFIGLLFVIGAIVCNVLLQQTYFIRLLEDKDIKGAFGRSAAFVNIFSLQFFVYYVLLYLFFTVVIYWAGLYYLYLGVAVTLFFLLYSSLFLGYLMRRKFYPKMPDGDTVSNFNVKQLFATVIFFGTVNYVLTSAVVINQFTYITGIIESQRDNYFLARELKRYTNTVYRFTIEYPQSWNIYEWRDSSVTFYNNYTGTLSGGIWLNISVTPYDERTFLRLYNARPGLVSLDNQTKDVTTKVSNVSIQGNEGVNYTVYHVKEPYPEYRAHYMVKRDNYIYEVTFTTLDKDIEGNNTELFERIIGSLRFID
jgi:hypothetical protein